jgi:hypothetical protein
MNEIHSFLFLLAQKWFAMHYPARSKAQLQDRHVVMWAVTLGAVGLGAATTRSMTGFT